MKRQHFFRHCLFILAVVTSLMGLKYRLTGAELSSVIRGRDWASIRLDARQLARAEQITRKWLTTVAELQRRGGWRLKYKAPWNQATEKTVIKTDQGLTIIDNRKPYSTAFTAMQFVYAWETFGEQALLDVALRTVSLYLQAEDKQGWWMHTIMVDDSGKPLVPEKHRVGWRAPGQDGGC